MATSMSQSETKSPSFSSVSAKQKCDGRNGDAASASWARDDNDDVETGISLSTKTDFDTCEQRGESVDLGLGLGLGMGGRRAGDGTSESRDGHGRKDYDDDDDSHINRTNSVDNGGKRESVSKAHPAPLYFPQEMRFRARGSASLPGKWSDKPQSRSTSVACSLTQAESKYGMFTVWQELQEGISAGAAAPTFRLSESQPFSSELQKNDDGRSGSQNVFLSMRRPETTAPLQQLPTQSNETPFGGIDMANASSSPISGLNIASALICLTMRCGALEIPMRSQFNGNAGWFPSQDMVSASLATSHGVLGCIDNLLARLAPDLLCNKEAKLINLTASQDPGIDIEEYCLFVRSLIGSLGQELKKEAGNPMQKGVALALWVRSIPVPAVHGLVIRSEVSLDPESDATHVEPGPASTTTARIDQDGLNSYQSTCLQQLAGLSKFILASRACASFKRRLLEFTHRPYLSRIHRAIGDDVVSGTGSLLQQDALKLLIFEVSWLPVHSFIFQESDTVRLPLLSRLRNFIESKTLLARNWWPSNPRYHPLREGFWRLQWISFDGTARHVDVPWTAGVALKAAFASAPAFLSASPMASGIVTRDLTTEGRCVKNAEYWSFRGVFNQAKRLFQSSETEYILPIAESNRGEKLSQYTRPADTNTPDRSSTTLRSNGKCSQQPAHHADSVTQETRYLYLCVDLGMLQFATIKCANVITERDFFAELKSSYDRTRGRLRRYFSIWQYHHCEFYLFGKWGMGLGGPLIKDSLPPEGDDSYDFKPRPPFLNLPCGSISSQEFYDRYYRSDCKYWKPPGSSSSATTIPIDREMKSMPLRTHALDWKNGQNEIFHGLLAFERVCYSRLLLYLVLLTTLLLLLALLIMILRGKGIEDLQTAFTPFQVALSLYQILVTLST